MFQPRAAIQSLFVPPDWSRYDNSGIVRREGKILGTFDRAMAIKREDLLFYAPGDSVFDSIIRNAMDSGRGRCCALSAYAAFDFKGFVFVYNVEPKINYLLERGISIQLLSQFRMYLPMKQIVVSVPFPGYESISDEQLSDYLYEVTNIYNAEHLGARTGKRGRLSPLEAFMENYPEDEWNRIVKRAGKAAREKAGKKVIEFADFQSARREINRIVNGYESEYLYLGRDLEKVKGIRKMYEAVYYALSNPVIALDSIGLMYLTRR